MSTLSIIVPVYNTEKYLHKCINSILAQTYTDFQLILVNDGSIDNCGEICNSYADMDQRVKVLHQSNMGVVSAIKNAMQYAIGEYIGFVDSDDWIEKDAYYKLMPWSNIAEVVACAWQEVRGDNIKFVPLGVPSGHYDKDKIKKIIYPNLLEKEGDIALASLKISRVNKIYRKSLVLANLHHYKEGIKASEDYAFYLATTLDTTSIYVLQNDYLYNYNIHTASTTASPNANFWQESLTCVRNLRTILQAKDELQLQPRLDLLAANFAATAIARSSAFGRKEGVEQIKHILSADEVVQGLAIPSHCTDARVRLMLNLMRKGKVHSLYTLSWLYHTIKKK